MAELICARSETAGCDDAAVPFPVRSFLLHRRGNTVNVSDQFHLYWIRPRVLFHVDQVGRLAVASYDVDPLIVATWDPEDVKPELV
jgi:hypothetical protein